MSNELLPPKELVRRLVEGSFGTPSSFALINAFTERDQWWRAKLEAAERELERWKHGEQVEGDYVCPDSVALTEAQSRISDLEHGFDTASRVLARTASKLLDTRVRERAKWHELVRLKRKISEALVPEQCSGPCCVALIAKLRDRLDIGEQP